jgi:hypothetical protein
MIEVLPGQAVGRRGSPWELMLCDQVMALAHVDTIRELLDASKLTSPLLLSWEDMAKEFVADTMQLWLGKHEDESTPCCFMVTEIRQFPLGRMCFIILVGGKNLWPIARTFFPRFIDYCKAQKVDFIEATTKPGALKLLKQLGFQPTGVRCTRAVAAYN